MSGRPAALTAHVFLTWGEPPAPVAEKISWIRRLAEEQGRTLRFGIRLHTISRDTAEDAWAEADRLLDGLDPAEVSKAQQAPSAGDSVGRRRMRALHEGFRSGGTRKELEVAPNLWAYGVRDEDLRVPQVPGPLELYNLY